MDNEEVLRLLIVQRNVEKIFVAEKVGMANTMLDQLLQQGLPRATILSEDGFNVSGGKGGFGCVLPNTPLTRAEFRGRNSSVITDWRGNGLFIKNVQLEIE